jgi:hypothetical protein
MQSNRAKAIKKQRRIPLAADVAANLWLGLNLSL